MERDKHGAAALEARENGEMVATYQTIGKRVARVDGVDKVTGRARYAASDFSSRVSL